MKNYYEILEVDKNASEEVIEKAYKTLAKKYHPDLQNNSDCQDKMRQINEAYEILSNDFKRREYDEKIKRQSVSIEEYNRIIQENNRLKKDLKRVVNQREMSQNQGRLEEMSIMQRYYEQIKKATKQPQMRYERKKTKISLEKIKKIVKEKKKNKEKVLQKSKFCCILWVSHIFFTTQVYGGEQT